MRAIFVQLKCNHMKKNIIKSMFCLFAIAAVSPDYAALAQGKGESRSIIINNGDTTVNGRKFSELDKNEREKLRKEFKEMERNFRGGGTARSENKEIVIRKGDNNDIVISGNVKEPNVLVWRDNFNDDFDFNLEGKTSGDLKAFKFNRDSLKNLYRDRRVFRFNGDSLAVFSFNADSLMKRFDFKMDGLDSNLRKRIITMHRDNVPGFPGSFERMELPGMRFEGRTFPGFAERNNSTSSTYNHTDKDGISNRMSIRINDANKEQLKKITGAETIAKALEVSDLTLFPNFSNGKMTLSFNLASKGTAKINVLDTEMKTVFTDDVSNFSGNYIKQFTLPKNGVYYVTVSQNGNWFVKRLVKE